MARIVLGLGTSHTPMLLASDETLERFVETDRRSSTATRKAGRSPTASCWKRPTRRWPTWSRRSISWTGRTRRAPRSGTLRQVLSNAKLDALIAFGDDQNESYLEDCRPAFAIYYGEHDPQRQQAARHLFAPAGVVHQEPRRVLRAGEAARLSGAFGARAAPDRTPDGCRVRSRRVEVPARGRRRRPRDGLCAPPRDGRRKAGADRAGVSQHLLPADPAAAAALLSARPGDPQGGRKLSGRRARRRPRLGRA